MTMKKITFLTSVLLLMLSQSSKANDINILAAAIIHQSHGEYLVNVKLEHHDTGWQHYADEWRLVDNKGNILGSRVLQHPHVHEQPFTRSLSNVKLSSELQAVYIEAHDKVHGWTKNRLMIDLTKMQNGRITSRAK
tara:strand:+ start:651 stop:1058 length:408 start_codon:yes stop_codon:yes gene_type:complete